jgi:hypothetical protein
MSCFSPDSGLGCAISNGEIRSKGIAGIYASMRAQRGNNDRNYETLRQTKYDTWRDTGYLRTRTPKKPNKSDQWQQA